MATKRLGRCLIVPSLVFRTSPAVYRSYPAPITYAQAGQINVQAPWEIADQKNTNVSIIYDGSPAGSVVVPVAPSLPGIFYVNNSIGTRNSSTNPAKLGDYIAVYGTGGGTLNPPGLTGQNWGSSLSNLNLAATRPSTSAPFRQAAERARRKFGRIQRH
jgi:uncharacterized protein (TIGR03437 family)